MAQELDVVAHHMKCLYQTSKNFHMQWLAYDLKLAFNHRKLVSLTPQFSNLVIKISWSTVSKAFERSIKITSL